VYALQKRLLFVSLVLSIVGTDRGFRKGRRGGPRRVIGVAGGQEESTAMMSREDDRGTCLFVTVALWVVIEDVAAAVAIEEDEPALNEAFEVRDQHTNGRGYAPAAILADCIVLLDS